MIDSNTRTSIAELKRRNRAAGRRLSPLGLRTANNARQLPSGSGPPHQTRTGYRRQFSSALPEDGVASRTLISTQNVKHQSRSVGASQFSMTAPTPIAGSDGGCGNENHLMKGQAVRRVPTKPSGSSHASSLGDERHLRDISGKNIAESSNTTTLDLIRKQTNSALAMRRLRWAEASFKSETNDASRLNASAVGLADELESFNGYHGNESWDANLSQSCLAVLDGDTLEEPYTTDLWKQTVDVEKPRVGGYYACVRCKVPIVAPEYQITYSVRGIAAFECLNKNATEVRIAGLGVKTGTPLSAGGSRAMRLSFVLHVVCRCCNGFLGILSPEAPSTSKSPYVFIVNSCCLQYVAHKTTRCRLNGIYDDIDDSKSDDTTSDDKMIDFDDVDIFGM